MRSTHRLLGWVLATCRASQTEKDSQESMEHHN